MQVAIGCGGGLLVNPGLAIHASRCSTGGGGTLRTREHGVVVGDTLLREWILDGREHVDAGIAVFQLALCGAVGLKPAFGRCSRAGLASLSWSLDHVGPLTRTVGDAAICLNAHAGYDPRDPGCVDVPTEDYTAALGKDIKGLRIGVPTNYFFDNAHPKASAATRAAIDLLAAGGR